MKLKSIFALTGLMAALSLSLLMTSAEAQGGRRGGRNGGNQGNPGGFNGQNGFGPTMPGAFNPMQMMNMGGGNIIDPAQTAKATLVYRIDVQNALGLDLRQKNALDALKAVQAQNQQKMFSDMRTMVQNTFNRGQNQAQGQNQVTGQPQALPVSPEDRQQQIQDVTEKAKGIVQGYQDDLLKKIDEILTPKQRKRLGEIDLRWRGPMALVDPKVAEQAQIGTEDKKKAQDSYKDFSDARQKLVMSMMPAGMRARFATTTTNGAAASTDTASEDGAAPPAAPAQPATPAAPLTPQEQQLAQKKALADFEKHRVALGVKLVATVSPDLSKTWAEMIGAPITFRTMDQ